MKTTATREELITALAQLNLKYEDNIVFKTLEPVGRRMTFTLTVRSSRGKGSRISAMSGNRVSAACWHAHGDFFDWLWKQNKSIVIHVGTLKMTGPDDNWQDRNIGSQARPCMFSEACDCGGF
jgi:hypothetical protein